jgi:hypothetical protein
MYFLHWRSNLKYCLNLTDDNNNAKILIVTVHYKKAQSEDQDNYPKIFKAQLNPTTVDFSMLLRDEIRRSEDPRNIAFHWLLFRKMIHYTLSYVIQYLHNNTISEKIANE